MADIDIKDGKAEQDASGISSAAKYFSGSSLTPIDSRSTITANQKSQDAFNTAQSGITSFGAALDQDAENIRSLGVAFKEFDEMMGRLSAGGGSTSSSGN